MTSRERFELTMAHQPIDRPPIDIGAPQRLDFFAIPAVRSSITDYKTLLNCEQQNYNCNSIFFSLYSPAKFNKQRYEPLIRN